MRNLNAFSNDSGSSVAYSSSILRPRVSRLKVVFIISRYLATVALIFFNKAPKGPAHATHISVVLMQFYDCTQFELLRFNIEETVYSSIVSYGG